MQINPGMMAEGNSGGNVTNVLQMIQSMNQGQLTPSGSNLMNLAADGEDGNPFSEILLQQVSLLLQAGGVELSDASASQENLLSAIAKLLEQDQTQTEDALNGLAFLAFAGQQFLQNLSTQQTSSGDGSAGVTCAGSAMEAGQINGSLPGGLLASLTGQAMKDHLQETSLKGDEQASLKTGLTAGENAIGKAAGESISQNMEDPGKAGAAFSKALESLLQSKNGEGEGNNIANASTPETEGALDKSQLQAAKDQAAATLNVSADHMNAKLKDAAAEAQGAKIAAETTDVESRLGKDGINIKTLVSDQKTKVSTSQSAKAGDDQPQVSSVAGEGELDANIKASANANTRHGDRNMESAPGEMKNGTIGKSVNQSATATKGATDAADQIKSDLNGRTGNVEKSTENNFVNSSTLATGTSRAGEKGDISASSIVNRVAAEFRENITSEGGRVKITLTPPSLGSLEMDVTVQNSKVKVMLIAENKDVQRILSGNIETLKTTLQSQGLTIERCDVMMQDNRDYPQGFNGQQAFGQDSAERERTSRQEIPDDKSPGGPSGSLAKQPVRRPQYSGSESISLFA